MKITDKKQKERKPRLTLAERKAKRAAEIAAMTPSEKAFYDFNNRWHRIGRIWNTIGLLLIISVPIVICLYYKVSPNWAVFGNMAVITVFIMNQLSCLTEPVIYAPMLGTNGEYLAFITGNLSNLKIPCVVKAHEIAGTKIGTEENELVSTIAVAVSSLVTALIIAVIVFFLAVSPLQKAIEGAPYLTPAFGCVVYALFGSLGGKYMVKNPKMAMIPGGILIGLSALISGVTKGKSGIGSLSIMVGIVFCAAFALYEFLSDRKKRKARAAAEAEAPSGETAEDADVNESAEATEEAVEAEDGAAEAEDALPGTEDESGDVPEENAEKSGEDEL